MEEERNLIAVEPTSYESPDGTTTHYPPAYRSVLPSGTTGALIPLILFVLVVATCLFCGSFVAPS